MMAVLLLLGHLFLLLFCARLFNKDYANPGVIYVAIWFIASVATILYSLKWGTPLSIITVSIILLGNVTFVFGVLFSSVLYKNRISLESESKSIVYVSNLCFLIVMFFFVLATRVIYSDIVYLASQANRGIGSIFRNIELARHITTNYNFSTSRVSTSLLRVNYAIGVVFFYFLCEAIFAGVKNWFYKCKLVTVSMLSVGVSVLSTGRTELLGLISGYGVIYILFYSKQFAWKDIKYSTKMMKVLFKLGSFFIALFMIIGVFVLNRIDGEGYLGVVDNLVKYMGSSIQAFDFFLNNLSLYEPNQIFGQNTLIAVYGTLKSLGFVDYVLTPFLPAVSFNGDRTNVYTIYYYFVKDFGYLSAIFLPSLYGFFYGFLYYRIKKVNFTPLLIIVYALLAYPLVISFFQEALLSLITTHINRIIFAVVIYFLVRGLGKIRLKL